MRKKFLLMTFLTLLFTAMGTSVLRAQVAKVGNTEYATIDEAIAAWTNNTTLTLLADVTLSDVVTINSTEHHILNLSTYTMTAASGKNAFVIKACGNGSAERSTITINADATNPGGIDAGSKCIIYYKYADGGISTEDRPIIKINGGVFTGSTSSWGTAGIYTIGTAARKCATVNVAGGTFDCSIVGSGKSKLIVSGGLFNYTVSSQGDSTCSRLISGGTFKTLGFMTADDNNTKFWIGTSMGNSNVGTYIDDNGYLVVGGPVVDEPNTDINEGVVHQASTSNYGGWSSYLKYSSANDYGLYYTNVEEALADNNKTSGSVTVYVDELDMTGISYKGTIVVPEDHTITITNAPENLKVTDANDNIITPDANGSYTAPAGNDFTGYTGTDGIWGEVWGNAKTSFVIKVVDANGNEMGTTSLNNIGGIIDGDVNVTWNIKLDAASNTDQYWTMEWTTAPTIDNMPAKVELWVDGVKVSGGNVVLNGPDEIDKIYAAVTDEARKIYSYHKSIADAITAINNTRSVTPPNVIALLRDTDEAITLPAGITLNLNDHDAPNVSVPVAQIGDQTFTTLQAAIDAVQNGETIELLSDVTENVTLTEATDLYYTIDGGDKNMNGTITVNPLSDTNDNRRITISNINFVEETDANVDFISAVSTNHYPRLTISGCDFTGSGNDGDVAIRLKSSYSVVIENCTGTGLHSFLQNTSGCNLTINNVTVTNSKSGLALGTVQGVTVKDSNIDVNGYGIRLDAQYNNNAVIESNVVEAFIPVVVRKAEVVSSITFSGTNTMTASNTDGLWCAIGTSEYETNGTMPTAPTGQVTVTLNDTGLSMDGVYGAFFPVKIGETGYATLAAAAVAAQAGETITLFADVTEDVSLPAGITLNGNGKQINGSIVAGGDLTIKGHTKATSFNAGYNQPIITIGAGACLEITGTGRMVIGHGATFSITGTITDAKNANVADLTPSLIMPGASFTGAGVTFNVTNAYISAPSSYCSSSSSASGTFDFNITNSIWESAGKLAFESQSTAATVNFDLVESVLNTGSHLVFGVSRGEVVIDNSNVNVGTSRQIENQSTMTIKNGSVVNGAVATSSNAKNPGTIIVEDATYAVTGEFSGSDLGIGTLIVKKGATVSAGSITKANIQIDATGMAIGDVINLTANLTNLAGTLEVINNDNLDAEIKDGKIVLVEKPVAKIGETEYATLQAALNAAAQTEELTTIQLLAGTHTFGNVKFPATLKNVTIVGADNKATIIKDSKLYSADGNAVTYKGITFDGIVFDNSGILFTGARNGEVVYEDWTIKNCDFRNLQSTDGIAAIHFNLLADETIKNFTFEKNTITNVTSPSNTASGLRLNYVTGNVVIKDNETNNVAFNAVQIINSEVDNFTFEGNILRSNGGSLANLYNVTGENIVITKNQFLVANEDQKGVSNIAYADVSGNYWGGGAPINLPEGIVYSSYYTTVESDGTLGGLVELPQGNNFTGYTGVDAIWGEVWGNAKESFVIKVLDANDSVMGTTSLNNIDGIIDGDVTVTWSLKLDAASNTDEYWTMSWTTAPYINNMPAKVELWVDYVKVSGGNVVLNGPDNLNVIYAAVTDAYGKILSYHTSIAAAVDAAQQGNTIALLRDTDEEIKLPFGVTLNLNGFDAPNVTFTLPTAMIGETEYASVADALAAAQAANLADVVITIIGENTAATADNFNLVYTNKFDKVTFKQNNGGKVYYFNELYTGYRTNNGEFVFDGVNLVVTVQYMFEGNVKLSNNSFVKSTAEANCFVYNAEVTVEAGSKIDGVIEDIRGGSLIIDGGKTDGTYCSEPGLRDAILTVNWTNSNLVLKNGAYVKVNSANEVGRLTVNGEMRVTDSKLESYQWIQVNENATLTLNAGSDITTQEVNGAGNIIVDVTGLEGQATVIKGDMTGFTGTITVNRGFYTVTADGLVVERGLSGEGTEANPYLINDISDLEFFRDQVNAGNKYQGKYVKLTADIDLNNEEWTPIGNNTNQFKGTFDGDNHTISNLVINGGSSSNQGFFGMTTIGEIKNVIFENAKVSGRLNVGVVAGTPYTSKYTNIKVKGHVEVNGMAYVGGVGGKNAYANWTNITVDVDGESYVKATSTENGTQYRTYVGGVIGFNGEGGHTFKNITSNINVIGDVCDIGGIFGIAHYGNKFENITHTGTVTNTNSNAEDVVETGLIAGVWHNQAGTSVTFTNTNSTGTISVPNVTGVTFPNDGLIGAAYDTSHETSSTSGSLTINGEQVYPYVAKIGEVGYNTLAKAITAAQSNDVVTLLWQEGEAPIAMNASLYGKNVTITGTATVDWSNGFLFVGRGGAGDAILTFDGANLTSASDNASTGIHVSGREKNTDNKYDGTVIIKNSTIELDYLINKGTMTLDNSTLTVKNGFSVGGRPASETESGVDATATITLSNNSKVVVNDHNGMGLGYEAIGVMNIDATSTFETTQAFLVTAKGTMNVNGGNVKVVGTLTNAGTVYVTGTANLDANVTGNGWFYMNGVTLDADTKLLGAKVGFINGVNTIKGSTIDNGFFSVGIGQNAAATTAAAFAGANDITLDDVTVNVSENAIIGGNGETYSGWVGSAYSADKTQHTYTLNVENSLAAFGYMHVSKDGIMNINGRSADDNKYTQDNSNVNFYAGDLIVNGNVTINNADAWVKYTKMSVDHADGVLNITGDTNYESSIHNGSTTGTSLVFYNAGKVNIANGTTIEIDNATTLVEGAELNIASANVIAKGDVTGNGAINFTALTAKLTAQGGLTIVDEVNDKDYKIVYQDGTYQFVPKDYVAKIDEDNKFETLHEAFDAAEDGDEIVVLKNIVLTEGITVAADDNMTLDLNGKTISMQDASGKAAYAIKNNGSLTIKDSAEGGKITFNSTTPDNSFGYATSTIGNGGHLTIENGLIENTTVGGASYAVDGIWHTGEASLTINGGTITATQIAVRQVPFSATAKNTVTINGGTLTGATAGLQMFNINNEAKLSETIIKGGTFNGTYGFYTSFTSAQGSASATINIDGGTFNGYVYLYNGKNGSNEYPMTVAITDGLFKSGAYIYTKDANGNEVPIKAITGGTFSEDPSDYCAEGYSPIFNGSTYTVIQVSGTQTRNLVAGWSWFSTYVDIELADLQTALGANGVQIKGQEGFTQYYSGLNSWSPGLSSISPVKMYMIKTNNAQSISLEGDFVDEDRPITLNPGWNWIGYPVRESVALLDAIENIQPSAGDVIKSHLITAYYQWGQWIIEKNSYGDFIMTPGEGYMYYSNSAESYEFTYSKGTGTSSKTASEPIEKHWNADATQYANNMTMIAMLSIDGEIVKGDYEIAAFANGECRGSARPIYIEAIDSYVLIMTINGEEVEELSFKYYDVNNGSEYELSNRVNYSNNAILGTAEEPYMLTLDITGVDEVSMSEINIYPNPTTIGSAINLQATCDKVEVFNALGVKIAEYQNVDSIDAFETAGIYVIRVTDNNEVKHCRLVVK